jgi:bifunctional non-homologous end joining protein LigD
MDRQLARGKIDIVLHGRKLRGGFTLIKTGTRSASPRQAKNWLLVKRRDEYADSSWNIEAPARSRSVLTGRTLEAIARGGAPLPISRRSTARRLQ